MERKIAIKKFTRAKKLITESNYLYALQSAIIKQRDSVPINEEYLENVSKRIIAVEDEMDTIFK